MSAYGRFVFWTVDAEVRAAEWYVQERAVMRQRFTGMDVLLEELAGHAHSGDGDETVPLQGSYESYQEVHHGLSVLGRERPQVFSYGIRPPR